MSSVKVTVSLLLELDEIWGVEALLEVMEGATDEEKERAIIELIFEDLDEFLDGARWSVDIRKDPEGEENGKRTKSH